MPALFAESEESKHHQEWLEVEGPLLDAIERAQGWIYVQAASKALARARLLWEAAYGVGQFAPVKTTSAPCSDCTDRAFCIRERACAYAERG